MTLKELIEKHGLPLKVTDTEWNNKNNWVEIRYIEGPHAYGHDWLYTSYYQRLSCERFEKYEEPKKLVRKYSWAYQFKNSERWHTLGEFFREESDVRLVNDLEGLKLKRLDNCFIDVEE